MFRFAFTPSVSLTYAFKAIFSKWVLVTSYSFDVLYFNSHSVQNIS